MNKIFLTFLISFSLFCAGCRNDKPPQLSVVCTLDGLGGGDCADPQGKYIYKSPSEMKNWWATTQTDEANYSSWCYGGAPQGAAGAKLEQIRSRILEAKRRAQAGET